jgi:hypothetical protein
MINENRMHLSSISSLIAKGLNTYVNYVLFTPYIFPDNHYLLHFECLAGQENGLIHTIIKRTSLVMHTASDLVVALNTHASFVNDV